MGYWPSPTAGGGALAGDFGFQPSGPKIHPWTKSGDTKTYPGGGWTIKVSLAKGTIRTCGYRSDATFAHPVG